jgi:predicted RNase H-like HicB family nuclease
VRKIKVLIEKHDDGYVAYPLGLRNGVAVVGQGNTYEEALADVTSAIRFTLESSSEAEIFDDEPPATEVFVAEVQVPLSAEIPR